MSRTVKIVIAGLASLALGLSAFVLVNRAERFEAEDDIQGIGETSQPLPPSPSPSPSPPPHPVSLQAVVEEGFDGSDFRVGRVLATTADYTRHHITYRSDGLTISGIMNRPRGDGPFPVLVLNHGYIDPAVYTNGRGLRREQDYLARRGYVVVHTDYRNHAQSDDDPDYEMTLRLGYIKDSANAIYALRASSLPYIDAERVGMLGHSMGGGVTLAVLVTDPELLDAAVLFAPVSSDYVDNYNKWIRGSSTRRALTSRIEDAYGSPSDNPEFWANVSARTFFDLVKAPVMIHHGTSDSSVPLQWSRDTQNALEGAGKDVALHVYEGEPHEFVGAWSTVMRRTLEFFNAHL
jgi:dipeptidyl aminopeptidase/acylaminoacyl peptidase